MKEKVSRKFWSKLAAGFFAISLIMTGVLFVGNGSSEVFASGTTKDISVLEVPNISEYRTEDGYTYPKPTEEGKTDYIFAGWYTDSTCTEAYTTSTIEDATSAWAKYVPAETMDVKFQVSAGTNIASEKTDLRMVSTVDSTNYKKVGYSIIANGKELLTDTQSVFKRIKSNTEGLEYGYSPVVFDTDSEYFVTFTIKNIKNKNFDRTYNVRPYWVTMDGTTVYGCGRNVKVSDSYNGIANVPVRIYADNVEAESTITVTPNNVEHFTYVGSEAGGVDAGVVVTSNNDGSITCKTSQTIEDANGMLVNLRFQINSTASSNEVFEMTGTGACDYLYRVFSTSYQGEPDTSWYDEFKTENTFVITTPADLYGFAAIVNDSSGDYKSEQFAKDTILLGADITVNKGQATAWSTTEAPEYNWTPIGKHISNSDETQGFAGTFDGQMHTISGVYLDTSTQGAGLFGLIATGGVVSNFSLKNSYFNSSNTAAPGANAGAYFGSIAGVNSGTVSKISSDAIVIGQGGMVGGIVGRMLWRGSVKECWFDGEIDLKTTNGKQSGGIVGYARGDGTFYIEDCLYTGKITTVAYSASAGNNKGYGIGIGGILGNAYGTKKTSVVNITNCISAGELVWDTSTGDVDGMSVVMGSVEGNYTLNLTNVYGTNESSTTTDVQRIYYQKSDVTPTINETGTLTAKSELSGYEKRSAVNSLGIYTNHAKDNTKAWVITETGVPQLKAFCGEWLDFGWYDDHNNGDYMIATAEEMYALSLVSQSGEAFSGKVVKLEKDINLNSGTASVWATTDDMNIIGSLRTWTPIGQTTAFVGTFEGQKHTISGLYINETTTNYVGLFGQVNGTVQNFRLNNSYVNSTKTYTGSVVGFLYGNMDGVYSDAYIYGTATELGGLVGRFGGNNVKTISNSWFAGNVEAAGNKYLGGIVGCAQMGTKTIQNCLNTGSISGGSHAGGLVGYICATEVSLENCLHTGLVDPAQATTGAIVGWISGKTKIQNVYTKEDVKGNQANGITGVGWTGFSTTKPITGEPVLLEETQITGMNAYINTDLDYYDTDATDNAWAIVSDGTPVVKKLYDGVVETSLSGLRVSRGWYYNAASRRTSLVNENTKYDIQDVADFRGMAAIVNNGVDNFKDDTITVSANTKELDLSEGWTVTADENGTITTTGTANAWTPIGNTKAPFAGTFNGNGCEISGVSINSATANTGLFGYCTGTVRDFSLKNSYITSSLDSTGSVVGYADGATVENIYSNAYVVCTRNERKDANIGGIVGHINCLSNNTNATGNTYITGCWFDGLVTSTGQTQYTGGILGRHQALNVTISDCLFTGKVITASTNANTYTGGIVGGLYAWYANGVALRINNTVSNGEVVVNSTIVNAIGSVIGASDGKSGYTRNVYMQNVYDTTNVTSQKTLTLLVNGAGKHSSSNYNLTGIPMLYADGDLNGNNAYKYTNLIFRGSTEDTTGTGAWVATENGPELYNFSDTSTTSKFTDVIKVETDWYYNEVQYSGGTKQIVEYGITDVNDFRGLPTIVNDGVDDFAGYTIKVSEGATINLSEGWTVTADEDGTITPTGTANIWTPIGNTKAPFAGTFNGNDCEIRGVFINSTAANTGLFGYCTGTIKDFSLKNSYITSSLDSTGSVVGYADNGARVENIYSDAYVVCTRSTGEANIGGIVGQVFCSSNRANATGNAYITGCWFEGLVKSGGTSQYAGGILGRHQALNVTISDCLFTGKVITASTKDNPNIGGIVGGLYAWWANGVTLRINNTISNGEVVVDSSAKNAIGSVIGASNGGTTCTRTVKMENVYDATEITSQKTLTQVTKSVGAFLNNTTREGTTVICDAEELYGTWGYQNTLLNFKSTWAARTNAVPGLAAFVDESVDISTTYRPDTTWYNAGATELKIENEEDMYRFMQLLAEGYTFEGMTITVMANLVMNKNLSDDSVSTWQNGTVPNNKWILSYSGEPTKFAGTFDGGGKTISGIYCVGDDQYLGLFGTTLTGSTVKDFKLTDSYFKQTGTGSTYTGSIAGNLQGEINSVYSNAIIDSVGKYTGGLAALATGTNGDVISKGKAVKESETTNSETNVTTITQTITVTRERNVVNMTNCWFDGQVNVTVREQEAPNIGGLVARVMQGKIEVENCLFSGVIRLDGDANSEARVGGLIGSRYDAATGGTEPSKETVGSTTTITNTVTNYVYIEDDGTQTTANTTINIDSCVAAGEINTDEIQYSKNESIGAVVATVKYGAITNTFATRETYLITDCISYSTFGDKQIIQTYNTDRLIGYCVEEKYGSKLDFEGQDATWSMRTSGVPIPKTLESVVGAENIVNVSTLNAEIGLNTWNKTLAEAVDYGMGNYVVSASATYDTYSTYLETLGTLGFAKYTDNSESDMDDDGVYNAVYTKADGDWVLSITFVTNEGKVYISISTVEEKGLSPYLKASEENIALANAGGNVSFTMLEISDGNGFVFQLPNGNFIVNDGGKVGDGERLIAYLREKAGEKPVIIDAWIFTHLHQDHSGAAAKLFEDASLRNNVYVNGIYLSEPNLKVNTMDPNGKELEETIDAFKGLMTLTQEDGVSKPAVYRMHMGERYYFSGMTVDVVQTQEQIPSSGYGQELNVPDYTNTMSTNCVYTLKSSESSEKKILLGGDSTVINMEYIMMAYGKDYETYSQNEKRYGGTSKTLSNINIFAAYHHGKNAVATYETGYTWDLFTPYSINGTATNEWADYLLRNINHTNRDTYTFDAILFPYKEVFDVKKYDKFTASNGQEYTNIWGADDGSYVYPYNLSVINQYYIKNASAYYTYGYQDHDAAGIIPDEASWEHHGSVEFIFKPDGSFEPNVKAAEITR